MAPSPITRSASEQLALAQTKEFKFLQLVELLKLDYEMYHNQIHLFDERIRQGSSATPPLQQPLMAWLEHERACAAFNLGHRRGKWTEYLGKIKVVKSRVS